MRTRDKTRRLARDLDALLAGRMPDEQVLAGAPVLERWSLAGPILGLHGSVYGHPKLGNSPDMRTAALVWLEPRARVARTVSRWYRLGTPAPCTGPWPDRCWSLDALPPAAQQLIRQLSRDLLAATTDTGSAGLAASLSLTEAHLAEVGLDPSGLGLRPAPPWLSDHLAQPRWASAHAELAAAALRAELACLFDPAADASNDRDAPRTCSPCRKGCR